MATLSEGSPREWGGKKEQKPRKLKKTDLSMCMQGIKMDKETFSQKRRIFAHETGTSISERAES